MFDSPWLAFSGPSSILRWGRFLYRPADPEALAECVDDILQRLSRSV
jgi:hypothetical protein